MADGLGFETKMPMSQKSRRDVPDNVAERLIVALDVPTIFEADTLVSKLDGIVSFFKIGPWLQMAEGVDSLISKLRRQNKKIFLDAKMFDIGETVKQGVARAVDRGISFVTVHGDIQIMQGAIEGKGVSDLKVFAITVLTSLNDDALRELGYGVTVKQLIELRVKNAVNCKVDGIIASADDRPDEIRQLAGAERLLIATPGIRPAGASTDDHKRLATPGQAISAGADYLVVGRPIIKASDPVVIAQSIIEEMREASAARHASD